MAWKARRLEAISEEFSRKEGEKVDAYQKKGYKGRIDYLKTLAEEYECPVEIVYMIANMLGKNEDFDGLISSLEDF
ncbi:MAG: hypothetical protein DDT29_00711 [Dehalococcoidia bacterium]|nr:hypothetical protein [Bacillota bacterium]